jgi:pyruvate/oxaloacetate carboxyltransferase
MTQKILFRDLTLRDGQQSLAATRMTTEQALRVIETISDAGFAYLEVWGGATLDSALRYLNEDPFERLEAFRDVLGPDAHKIQALVRGQNLFAYQPYPDDLVIAFIKQAVDSGVQVLRIFDALNDSRNLQIPLLAGKASGAEVEAALAYTISPVHTVERDVRFARRMAAEGADSIAIKDMAGILRPWDAVQLYRDLKATISLPISFHSHDTAGVGTFNALLAMMAGIDVIDTCITPFASGPSHPPVELMIVFAEALGLDHGLDKELVLRAQRELFKIFDKLKAHIPYAGRYYHPVDYADFDPEMVETIMTLAQRGTQDALREGMQMTRALLQQNGYPLHDERIFAAQIPGGMFTNLQSQLKGLGRAEIMDEVLAEVPRVREKAGYPPLVTPTSQIIGSQATYNVMTGEPYSFVSNEFKMLLRGEFGRTPVPPDPALVARVLGPDEPTLTYRPASYLMPVLEDDQLPYFVRTQKERLLHHMLGQPADDFLQQRYDTAGERLDQLMHDLVVGI